MSRTVFTIRTASGDVLRIGEIQGCGGRIAGKDAEARVRKSIERANEGDSLHIYEPKRGHCRFYPGIFGEADGEDLDLRGATLLAVGTVQP